MKFDYLKHLRELVVYASSHPYQACVLVWAPEHPFGVHVVGPFRNKTEASKWGREHAPYRHKVGGICTSAEWNTRNIADENYRRMIGYSLGQENR